LTGKADNEDAAVLTFPAGKALVQTVDFLTPVVNDPYRFGQIAAANALSDVYAMGGEPWAAMNVVCFPAKSMSLEILKAILAGGLSKIREAGAALAGGHSVEDAEIKYGLSVSGTIDPGRVASNSGARPGDQLLLTKPLGIGILSTAVKAHLPGAQAYEDTIWQWASRLNAGPGRVIRELGLRCATDITGFGLGGHALEVAQASRCVVALDASRVPVLTGVRELAEQGLVPAGSHANRRYFADRVSAAPGQDPYAVDVIFDAQTSGGMLLCVPPAHMARAVDMLEDAGDLAVHIGEIMEENESECVRLVIR